MSESNHPVVTKKLVNVFSGLGLSENHVCFFDPPDTVYMSWNYPAGWLYAQLPVSIDKSFSLRDAKSFHQSLRRCVGNTIHLTETCLELRDQNSELSASFDISHQDHDPRREFKEISNLVSRADALCETLAYEAELSRQVMDELQQLLETLSEPIVRRKLKRDLSDQAKHRFEGLKDLDELPVLGNAPREFTQNPSVGIALLTTPHEIQFGVWGNFDAKHNVDCLSKEAAVHHFASWDDDSSEIQFAVFPFNKIDLQCERQWWYLRLDKWREFASDDYVVEFYTGDLNKGVVEMTAMNRSMTHLFAVNPI